MKNQYVGDIGDYGKYSLLRAFANAGVKVGVNWYLTEDDGSTDGKFTKYLENDDFSKYDKDVFDALKPIVKKKSKSVKDIQKSNILPGAVYYPMLLKPIGPPKERVQQRKDWFEKSMETLSEADLIFMDPDNGLLESEDASKLGAEKFILPCEVEEYFSKGKNVVYYCHKGRRKLNDWLTYMSIMANRITDAKPIVLTYHKGTQRSYILLIHDKDFAKYRGIIDRVKNKWDKVFSEEYTQKGDVSGKAVGEPLVITCSNDRTVTIKQRADGRIQVEDSRESNTSHIFEVGHFLSSIGLKI